MKTVSVVLILCGICLFCSEGHAAEWVQYFLDKQGNQWSYDRESIIFRSQNLIGLSGKGIYSKDGVRQIIAQRTKAQVPTEGFDELSYIMERFELNCKKREFDISERTFHNNTGKILHSYTAPRKGNQWYSINPGSKMDALLKAVCTSQAKEPQEKKW